MKHISETQNLNEPISANKVLKDTFDLANPRLSKMFENLIEYRHSYYNKDGDYLDFKHEFEKFYNIIRFIQENGIITSDDLIIMSDGYESFNRQFSVYEKSDKSTSDNQLSKLCDIAIDNLKFKISSQITESLNGFI